MMTILGRLFADKLPVPEQHSVTRLGQDLWIGAKEDCKVRHRASQLGQKYSDFRFYQNEQK